MAINQRQLEAFRTVMLTGSMTGAAELMYITQPAVSRLIRDLEITAGFPLFFRNGPRIQPTAEAVRFNVEVQRHMAGLKELQRTLDEIRTLDLGGLRVSAMTAAYLGMLTRISARFLVVHPGVNLHLSVDNSRAILQQVVQRQLEIGFGAFPPNVAGAIIAPLAPIAAPLAIPHDHRLARQSVVNIEDLEGEPFLTLGRDGLLRHRVDQIFRRAGVRPKIVVEASLSAMIHSLVALGVGVGVIDPLTASELNDPRVVLRPLRPVATFEIALARSALVPESRLASEFTNILLEEFTNVIPLRKGAPTDII